MENSGLDSFFKEVVVSCIACKVWSVELWEITGLGAQRKVQEKEKKNPMSAPFCFNSTASSSYVFYETHKVKINLILNIIRNYNILNNYINLI